MLEICISFLICIVATTLGAISGIGGGVIIKPVMDAVSGLPVTEINFLSGCTVLCMSIVSLFRSRRGNVHIKTNIAAPLALGAAIGGVLGSVIFDAIRNVSHNDGLIGIVQSILMILLTLGVFLYVLLKESITSRDVHGLLTCVFTGLFLGVLSSFLGIGGGPINLAVLYYLFSMDTKTAALNSIYIIFFSQMTNFISSLITGVQLTSPAMLVVMIIGGISGGMIGSSLACRMNGKQTDRLFMGLLAIITIVSCYNLYLYSTLL